jgi:hypothetical protein
MATPRDFYREFYAITKFEIVGSPKESDRQLRLVGRIRARAISRVWATQFVDALVRASTGNARWSVDVSRYYFEKDGEVIWAWRVIIQTGNASMESALDEILHALRLSARPTARMATSEVTEVPLVSPNPLRNAVVKGKGASNIREIT